jgi:hypothetical protein
MFFFLALFIGSFIISSLLGAKMKVENAKAASLDQFNFPRAKEGDPVPRFYGTVKLNSPNTISVSGFSSATITKKVKTGLFSSKKVITGYKYNLTVDLAWALGPGVVYREMWFGQNRVWTGCLYDGPCLEVATINWPDLYGGSQDGNRGGIAGDVALYCGNFDQVPDTYLAANLHADVPAYIGVAHTVFRNFWFGNTPSIDAISMEASYFVKFLTVDAPDCKHRMPNGLDANPVEVLYDILVTDWGNLGFSSARVDLAIWKAAALKVWDEQNGISINFANAGSGKDTFAVILRQINAIVYEDQTDGGLVKIKLIRYDYVVADLPVLTTSEITGVKNFTKKLWKETNNVVRLKYISRADNYAADKIAIAKDSSLLRFQGKERSLEVNMPGVKTAVLANTLAPRELSSLNVPLFSCEMTLSRSASNFKPGDVFVWQWPEYSIASMVMRIRKIGFGTLEDGTITFSVIQDEFSSALAVISAPADSAHVPTNVVAIDIATFRIVELPAWLDANAALGTPAGSTRFVSFVEKPNSVSVGYNAFIQEVPTDTETLHVAPFAETAVLQTIINIYDGFNTALLTSINIDTVADPAFLAIAGTERLGGSLVLIGNELFAYASFTDLGAGVYSLNDVRRALLDTNWEAHAIGAKIYFFDGQEGFFDQDMLSSSTPSVYFQNKTPTDLSSVGTATVTALAPVGRIERVIAPDYITIDAVRNANQILGIGAVVSIDARPRNRFDTTNIWFEDDAAGTAEAGTTYKLEYELASVVTLIADAITLPYSLTITSGMTGNSVLRLSAKKDGLYSISYSPMPIQVGDFLTIDSSIVTIDGEGITF